MNRLDFVITYVNDILIVTKSNIDENYEPIRLILQILRIFDLKISKAKLKLCGDSITYLGYIFSFES